MYKLAKNLITGEVTSVHKEIPGFLISIPFDPANTDYQQFKKDVLEGAELQDADGNVMTQEEANAYIATLP